MLCFREHSTPYIDEGKIEMRFGMILTEKNCALQAICGGVQVAIFELGQSQVQE